jgi:hypothetical protein
MTDLNVLLRRMSQREAEAGSLESAAATLLAGLLVVVALGVLL